MTAGEPRSQAARERSCSTEKACAREKEAQSVEQAASDALSQRSLALKAHGVVGPFASKAMARRWSTDDPEGSIVMVVAENNLQESAMVGRLEHMTHRHVHTGTCTQAWEAWDVHYDPFVGDSDLRAALAEHLSRFFLSRRDGDEGGEAAKHPVHSSQVVVAAGAIAALEQLAFCVADHGDGMLLIAPFWYGLKLCMYARMGVEAVVVEADERNGWLPTVEQLNAAVENAAARGVRCRAMLFCHPTNPLGITYSHEQLAFLIGWATSRGLHFVSDELYGHSCFDGRFVSAWDVAAEVLDARRQALVHVVWGLSKDFGVPGLRIGCLFTRNEALVTSVSSGAGCFAMVPGPMAQLVADILHDHAFCGAFLSTSRELFRRNYHLLTQHLAAAGVKYLPATGGLFFCLDLRDALPSEAASFDDEFKLFEALCEGGVVVTPGADFDAPFPGLFRVCPFNQEMAAADANACFAAFAQRVAGVVARQRAH